MLFILLQVLVSADRADQVQALAGDIVLCSWPGHFTFTVPLYTQGYKRLPTHLPLDIDNSAVD